MHEIDSYVAKLAASCPGIREIWLIGSRANGTAQPDSDCDLLVFGNGESLSQLQTARDLHRDEVDCLVLVDGTDKFKSAWGSKAKTLTVSQLEWERISPSHATYIGTKWREADNGAGVISAKCNAFRKWPP
jgi:predicted nucleotidyltransferase